MTAADRCERCDREGCRAVRDLTPDEHALFSRIIAVEGRATAADRALVEKHTAVRRAEQAACVPVDWRTRALAAEESAARSTAAAALVVDTIRGALAAHDSRGAGGQQVSYHGPFASMPPSYVREFRRIVEALTEGGPGVEWMRDAAACWMRVEPLIGRLREMRADAGMQEVEDAVDALLEATAAKEGA